MKKTACVAPFQEGAQRLLGYGRIVLLVDVPSCGEVKYLTDYVTSDESGTSCTT